LDAKGEPWPLGHHLVQTDLAKTLRAIAKEGAEHFYKGDFAKATAQWMSANGGIVTAKDFANYQWRKRAPVQSQYRDYTVYGFPPPSSGGVHVAQILNILEHFDLANMNEADRIHVLGEAMKQAFADRAHWLGDPDFAPVPKGLVDKDYAKSLAANISLTEVLKDIEHGQPPQAEFDTFGKHTTHIAAADEAGNWVAITTTVNTDFGSYVTIPGTGVIMNNQMDDFAIQPGVPNSYGLLGTEANSVQPGKRPLSSMSPSIVLKDGKPVITLGAAGGSLIITEVVLALVNYLDLGMPLYESLAAPKMHHQWRPDALLLEDGFTSTVRDALIKKGHRLADYPEWGSTQAIARDQSGKLVSVAEPRLTLRNSEAGN
jgi:gamma-glutamyltranspeptidase/glutathione hydrolase